MNLEELYILLPCHSLEDFPVHLQGEEAHNLLSCWAALWHPALIAHCEKMPGWTRVDEPPEELKDRLLVIPLASEEELQTGFSERASSCGALVIRKTSDRDEIAKIALSGISKEIKVPESIVNDFFALGFCFLQVELLTRQMRYMSNIDEAHFEDLVVKAAKAAITGGSNTGNCESTKAALAKCFELLHEAREHFYPVDSYFIDITLVASTTIGESLRSEIENQEIENQKIEGGDIEGGDIEGGDVQKNVPWNIMLCGATLDIIATDQSDTLANLRQQVENKTLGMIGGEYEEQELPLMSPEAILAGLNHGIEMYEKHLGSRPTVFGRRRFGLTPILPQLLSKNGFIGALHFTLDDGLFPEGEQSKIRWESTDGSAIDAICKCPLDANQDDQFLDLSVRMGETMDTDHVATVNFAHWPGLTSVWYQDLRRIAKYSPVLGKFTTVEDYFESTEEAGYQTPFLADQYKSPYLKQSIQNKATDPISRTAAQHQASIQRYTKQTLSMLCCVSDTQGLTSRSVDESHSETNFSKPVDLLAKNIGCKDESESIGKLVVNVNSFRRKIVCDDTSIDVPAIGFAWTKQDSNSSDASENPKKITSRKKTPLVAEGNFLRNEYLEVYINEHTGAVQSVRDYHHRGNLLTQQLALRMSPSNPSSSGDHPIQQEAQYSIMAADSVEVSHASNTTGEIVSKGRLVDKQGTSLANFTQRVQLARGQQMLTIDIELEPQAELTSDPWDSYYAARFAWSDATADLWRCVNYQRHPTEATRLESALYVDIETTKQHLTLLNDGAAYHRRVGPRMLDTILITQGEQQQHFRLGIGLDLKQPLLAALELISPDTKSEQLFSSPTAGHCGWFFHLSAGNIVSTYWQPIIENQKAVGIRARLLETQGRSGEFKFQAFKDIKQAKQTDFRNQSTSDLPVEEGQVTVAYLPHEWIQLEARWEV